MDHANDMNAYESGEMDRDEMVDFFQRMIDDGTVWGLQGSHQRTAVSLIAQGFCTA